MNNFIFENKTKVYFGKGCVGEYLPKIAAVHGDKVLLAYGSGSIKKNGVYEEVIAALEKAGKTIIEFPGIMENPTYKKVLEGTKLVKEKQVDWILAVGGGSVMDSAKGIALGALYDGDFWDYYCGKKGPVTAPLGPTKKTKSPASILILTLDNAFTLLSYTLLTFLNSII